MILVGDFENRKDCTPRFPIPGTGTNELTSQFSPKLCRPAYFIEPLPTSRAPDLRLPPSRLLTLVTRRLARPAIS